MVMLIENLLARSEAFPTAAQASEIKPNPLTTLKTKSNLTRPGGFLVRPKTMTPHDVTTAARLGFLLRRRHLRSMGQDYRMKQEMEQILALSNWK